MIIHLAIYHKTFNNRFGAFIFVYLGTKTYELIIWPSLPNNY